MEVFGFGEYFPGLQEGYFSMASSDNRLDPISEKKYAENVTKPHVDKKLHHKGKSHPKVMEIGDDTDSDSIIDQILNQVNTAKKLK